MIVSNPERLSRLGSYMMLLFFFLQKEEQRLSRKQRKRRREIEIVSIDYFLGAIIMFYCKQSSTSM